MTNGGPALGTLALLALVAAGSCESREEAGDFEAAIARSRAAMRELVHEGGVPGASIAVALDGEVVWTEGFGVADGEAKERATADTRFGIGSVTKALTTALFARLVDRGRAHWDRPLREHVPALPHEAVTARMIAGHLSGLDDTFSAAHRYTRRPFSTTEAVKEVAREPLRHAPGRSFFYATGTYSLLAGGVERITGLPFARAMRDEVLDRAGMSGAAPNDGSALPRLARFYEADEKGRVRAVAYNPSFKLAGAGYVATAADVARFGAAMLEGRLVSEASRRELFRPVRTAAGVQPVTGTSELLGMKDVGVGLGWAIATDDRGRTVIHQPGGGPGISAWLVLYPEERLVVAILSNLTGAPVGGSAFRETAAAFLESAAVRSGLGRDRPGRREP